ncbi:MAG: hypothetical protein Q9M40_00145 [Sulfurimonas sp.]|nr:hypothetical protein [Sulfurimonas sp.]
MYVTDSQSGMDDSMEDSKYKIQINRKNVAGTIEAGEYKVFDMKPETVLFTAVRKNIEEKYVKLSLVAGQTYYLKTQSAAFGEPYSFEQVNAGVARQDLKESKLAGSFEVDMAAYVPAFGGSTVDADAKGKVPSMSEAEIDAIIEKKLKAMGAGTAVVAAPAAMQNSTPSSSSSSKLNDIKKHTK